MKISSLLRMAAEMDSLGKHGEADMLDRILFAQTAPAIPNAPTAPMKKTKEEVPPEEPADVDQMFSNGEPPLYDDRNKRPIRPLRFITRPPKNPLRKIKNVT